MATQPRLPFPEGDSVGRGTVKQRVDAQMNRGRNPQPPSPGIAPEESHIHPGQLQAFMTPREIMSKYQALDGDRQAAEDERAGDMTARSRNTAGQTNMPIGDATRNRLAAWHGGRSQVSQYTHQRAWEGIPETDEQLFARKADEASLPPYEYRDLHGGSPRGTPGEDTIGQRSSAPSALGRWEPKTGEGEATFDAKRESADQYVWERQEDYRQERDWGPSLYDRIAAEGVQSPVHLSNQFGSQGKPEIAGGHHRLAVQNDIDPDQPIPVMHWNTFREARQSGRYT